MEFKRARCLWRHSKSERRYSQSIIESLERRDLLAADFLAGDANRDYYLDESDFVLAMKAGKYETGEDAEWSEGDWNGDGEFDSSDHLLVFVSGLYRQGPYDDGAGEPESSLQPLAGNEQGPVLLYYDSTNGDLRVGPAVSGELVTTIQIRSQSNLFTEDPQNGLAGLFDVDSSTDTRSFFGPSGYDSYVFRNALPTGMSIEALQADLWVDGSLLGGGGLGPVRVVSESPERDGFQPGDSNRDYYFDSADLIQVMKARKNAVLVVDDWDSGDWNSDGIFNSSDFIAAYQSGNYGQGPYDDRAGQPHHHLEAASVGVEQPGLTIYYDGTNGDVVAVPRDFGALTTLHIRSVSGGFRRTEDTGLFDISDENDYFFIEPSGEQQAAVPGLMAPGLTLDEVASDLLVDGSRISGGGFRSVAIASIRNLPSHNHDQPSCREQILNGRIPGDANLDGIFDSSDLTLVFRSAEYEDGIDDNSVWSEGDWDCNGEFDSADLVRAFESGYSRDAVAAAWVGGRLDGGDSNEIISDDGDNEDVRRRNLAERSPSVRAFLA